MAEELTLLLKTLKDILSYLVKIGPERRKGKELNRKIDEANAVYKQLFEITAVVTEKTKVSETELSVINELSTKIKRVYQEILTFKSANEVESKATMSAMDFFNLASKLLPSDFDGSQPKFLSFLDALELLKLNCGEHEANAVAFVKTRLTGKARDLITSETTLNEIIDSLKKGIRCKNSQAMTAAMQNCRQNTKDSAQYAAEVESLALNLKRAYITEGVPADTADSYTVNALVKTLSKNANSDKARIIMEAGNFNTVQDALSKFVTITPDSHTTNSVLHYKCNNSRGRLNYTRGRGQRSFHNNQNHYHQAPRGSFGCNRGRGSSYFRANYHNARGNFPRTQYNRSSRNIRYGTSTEPNQGNELNPQLAPLGVTSHET